MSAIDEFNPAPAQDYETLLFQFKTLCRMYNSTRSQCSLMAKTICDLNKQIADGALDAVESERAANAQLTAELESLRQERDGLRRRVAEAVEALQEIAAWPDGGNRYGQNNIKRFARSILEHTKHPSPAVDDGVRYRWLRHGDNDEIVCVPWMLRNEKLDAAIDAATAKEQGDGN